MLKKMKVLVGVLAFIFNLASLATAESSTPSKEEIAKELANPNTVLTSLKLQTQYFSFDKDLPRADDQDMVKLFFQPTIPFPPENGKTLWVRPGVPYLIDQPVYDKDSRRLGSQSGLGDIILDVQYGTTLENGFLWSVGFSSIFPTASEEGLGSEVWALGPGFQLGRVTEKSVFGVFANHQWDIAGTASRVQTPVSPPERCFGQPDGNTALWRLRPRWRLECREYADHDLQPRIGRMDNSLAFHGRKDLHHQRPALEVFTRPKLLRGKPGCHCTGMDGGLQRGPRGGERLREVARLSGTA